LLSKILAGTPLVVKKINGDTSGCQKYEWGHLLLSKILTGTPLVVKNINGDTSGCQKY